MTDGDRNPTERQSFWLEHLRACAGGSLKAYAEASGLKVRALYDAKKRLKRAGLLEAPRARLVRVERVAPAAQPPGLCRVHFRNGAAVELACTPSQWRELFSSIAALS